MFFFTIAEIVNKFFGLLLVSIISRALGVDAFAEFSLILVLFGYFLEIAFYSYQNKNLIEYNKDKIYYFDSPAFANRQVIIVLFSIFSAVTFSILCSNLFKVNALPLAIILLLPALTVDYVLYANGKSSYIIISRFFSQSCFLLILYVSVIYEIVDDSSIMYIYASNSFLLTVIVYFFAKKHCYIDPMKLYKNIKINLPRFSDVLSETKKQAPIFLSKIIILIIPTMEQPLLLINSEVNSDIVISHRIALIILPFIVFYLNSNADKISEPDMAKKIMLSSTMSCLAVIFAPSIVRVMFGEGYVTSAQNYSLFFFIVPFQSFLNYLFYLGIKRDAENQLFHKMYLCTLVYLLIFIVSILAFAPVTLVLVVLVFIKCLIFVFLNDVVKMKTKVEVVLSLFAPLLLALVAYNYTVFNGMNNFFIDVINYCENYKWI